MNCGSLSSFFLSELWKVKREWFDGDVCTIHHNNPWQYRDDGLPPLPSGLNHYPVLVHKIDYKVNMAIEKGSNIRYALKPFCASRRL